VKENNFLTPIDSFKKDIELMTQDFSVALQSSYEPDFFKRVVLTQFQLNPSILTCERKSVLGALMKAAEDGLLPDGQEGAIVPFGNKAQWMPMIKGIYKKLLNSGHIKSISAQIIYQKDDFSYWVDDTGEHVKFCPDVLGSARGEIIGAFAVVSMAHGGASIEVMTKQEIEKVRNGSRAKNSGPWKDWWEEMAKKTVVRRLAKRLPISSDSQILINRDEDFLEEEPAPKPEVKTIADVEKEAEKCESLPEKPAELSSSTEPSPLPPEPAKPEVPKISRKEMGKEIMKMSGELGWSAEALATWVQKEFKKTTKDLTDEEMFDCGNYLAELRDGKGDK
jgi:recombination protein RecT